VDRTKKYCTWGTWSIWKVDIKYECVCTMFVVTWTSTTWIESQQPCIICDPSPAFLISTTPAKPWSRSHKYTDEMPPSKYLQTNGNKILENTLDTAHILINNQQTQTQCVRERRYLSFANSLAVCSKLDSVQSVIIVKPRRSQPCTCKSARPHQIVWVTLYNECDKMLGQQWGWTAVFF